MAHIDGKIGALISAERQKAYDAGFRQAKIISARAIYVWTCLALRNEGYGKDRLVRFLDNLKQYIGVTTQEGGTNIVEQRDFLYKQTGLYISFDEEGAEYSADDEYIHNNFDFTEE